MLASLSLNSGALLAGCSIVLSLLAAPACAQNFEPLMIGSPAHGAELIAEKGCGACHMIPGIHGADGLVGPPLIQMGRRIFVAGLLRNTQQNLAAWVFDPQRFVPGNAMPSTGLTPSDALDVTAYLESIR
jgi:cytochrome c2